MDAPDRHDETTPNAATEPRAGAAPKPIALGQWEVRTPGAGALAFPRRAVEGLLAGVWSASGESSRAGTRVAAVLWGVLLVFGWWLVFNRQPFDKDWGLLFTVTPVGKGIALLLVVIGFAVGSAVLQARRTSGYALWVSLAALEGLVTGEMLAQANWRFGPVWFVAMVLTPLFGAGLLYLAAVAVTRPDNTNLARLAGAVLVMAALGVGCWFAPSAISGPLLVACRPGSPVHALSGRILDPTASTSVARLIALLESPDLQTATQAATRLGELADRDAIDPLHSAALAQDRGLAEAAVMALAHIPDIKALDAIMSTRFERNFNGRAALEPALALSAPRFADRAISDLGSSDVNVRGRAMMVLYYTAGPRDLDIVAGALSDPDARTRSTAVRCLGRIGGSRAVEPLIAASHDPDGMIRGDALSALAKIGDPRALQVLAVAVERSGRGGIATALIPALSRMPSLRAAQALLRYAADVGTDDGAGVAAALGSMKPEAHGPLIAGAVGSDYKLRRVAIPLIRQLYPGDHLALAAADRGEAIFDASTFSTQLEEARDSDRPRAEVLLHAYRVGTPTMIAVADDALREPLGRGDEEVYESALHDSNDRVRLAAVKGLGDQWSHGNTEKQMLEAMRDSSPAIRKAALEGLGPQGWIDEKDRPIVHVLLLHDADPAIRALAAKALEHLSNSKTDRDVLTRALSDPNPAVQQAARAALH